MLSGPTHIPEGKAESLVILSHGYGSNGDDLFGLAQQWKEKLPRTIFVAPNAPEPSPHPGGFQWFPISSFSREERVEGTLKAAPKLDDFISHCLQKHKIPSKKLALVGFSQGTMISLQVGLRRKEPIAGILGYSGALAMPEKLIAEITNKPLVFLLHGTQDNIIPFPAMFEAVGALEAAGVNVEKHLSQNIGHGIGPDGLQKGGDFLSQVLG